MTVLPIADIAGDNAAHALGTAGQRARWIKVTASGGTARLGNSAVAAAVGVLCPQNVPVTLESNGADPTDSYDLAGIEAYVPSGTTLTVTYGV